MAPKYTAETAPYKTPSRPGRSTEGQINSRPAGSASQKASYTPNSNINELSYGKSGPATGDPLAPVAGVQVGGSFESQAPPAMPGGNFTIGDNKNVSTPVSGG